MGHLLETLIMTQAMRIACVNEHQWPGIFINTSQFVRAHFFLPKSLTHLLITSCVASLLPINHSINPILKVLTKECNQIFFGCFQRPTNIQLLSSKVFDYLVSQGDSTWGRPMALESINSLVKCITETTEVFLASKITLRSQVMSLHANVNGQGKIPDVSHSSDILKVGLTLIFCIDI